MKRRVWSHLLVTALLICSYSQTRADERGNGGDAVVCEKAYPMLLGSTAMVLDLYETTFRWRQNYSLGGKDLTVQEKFFLMIERIKDHDPTRYELYKEGYYDFLNTALIEENLAIPELPDNGPVVLPGPDCQLVQLAVQYDSELPGDYYYYIKKEIWDRLSKDSKAVLILHEIAYKESSNLEKDPHLNSRKIRFFLSKIISDEISEMNSEEYNAMVEKYIQIPLIRKVDEMICDNRLLTFEANGMVSSCITAHNNWQYNVKYGDINIYAHVHVEFTENEKVKKIGPHVEMPGYGYGSVTGPFGLYKDCEITGSSLSSKFVVLREDKTIKTLHMPSGVVEVGIWDGKIPECYPAGGRVDTIQNSEDGKVSYIVHFNPLEDE